MKRVRESNKNVKLRPALGSEYKARKRERRRDELLDAATVVFAAKGFHNSTLKDIADYMGVLPPSLYHYIDSKEAALTEVCERIGHAFIESMEGLLKDERPAPVVIREAIQLHMQNNRGELVYNYAFRRIGLPEEIVPQLAKLATDYQILWEQLISRGIQLKEFSGKVDPHTAAIALLAMMNGSIEWYQRKSETEINTIAENFAAIAISGLGKQ